MISLNSSLVIGYLKSKNNKANGKREDNSKQKNEQK
jgi:hypothetical protein